MPGTFQQMGFFAYPLLLTAILTVVQMVRGFMGLGGGGRKAEALAASALGLGALGCTLGFLGTVMGFTLAAGAIQRASSISPPVVFEGVKVALSTSVFGLLILAVALIGWLAIRALASRSRPAGG